MTPLPILDYGDLLGQTLLFLAVCAGVVVAIRTWAHALTRENAAVALSRRSQRRRKSDIDFHCLLCGQITGNGFDGRMVTKYAHGRIDMAVIAALCADCHTLAPTGASPERAK